MDREKSNGTVSDRVVATATLNSKNSGLRTAMKWQLLVTSSTSRSSSERDSGQFVRADLSHASLPPHLALCWKSEVGWHQIANRQPSAGPTRPRMLDTVQDSTNFSKKSSAKEARPALVSDRNWPALIEMASPLAFDLQNSLFAAGQTLQAITGKVRSDNHLSLEDAQQLTATADSLETLANWSDDVLLSLKTLHGKCYLVRRRFRVSDWRNSLSNLLEGVARQRQVHLEWMGWNDGLPNLYLDPSIISKSLYNLTNLIIQMLPEGGSVRLQVGRQNNASRHLLLTIQTNEDVLSQDTIQIINGTTQPSVLGIENTAIMAAKQLIALHGGSITAHRDLNGGCDLRIALPVDTAESLVCSWLISNFQRGSLANDCCVHLYAVKLDGGNAEEANVGLQQAAGRRSLVIRVSKSRWLILELRSAGQLSSNSDTAGKALAALRNRTLVNHRQSNFDAEGSRNAAEQSAPVWLETLIYQTARINENALWNGVSSGHRLPQLVEEIAERVQDLMSRQQLIVDGFASSNSSKPTPPVLKKMEHAAKSSVRSGSSLGSIALTNSFIPTPHTSNSIAKISPEAPGTQVVSEIIRQWKIVQAKLAELNGTLSTSQAS